MLWSSCTDVGGYVNFGWFDPFDFCAEFVDDRVQVEVAVFEAASGRVDCVTSDIVFSGVLLIVFSLLLCLVGNGTPASAGLLPCSASLTIWRRIGGGSLFQRSTMICKSGSTGPLFGPHVSGSALFSVEFS